MSTWTFDQSHSLVGFSARHMMISTVRGRFGRFEGTLEWDESAPAASSMEVRIETASVDTDWKQRDDHLRSDDFFAADRHPLMTFRSTSVESLGDGRARVHGQLTIRDVTQPVTLDVRHLATGRGFQGERRAVFEARTRIDRERWGLTWNVGLEAGGLLVSREIEISLEVTATEVVPAVAPEPREAVAV